MSMTNELKMGLLKKAITIVEHESFTDWNSKRKAPLYSFKRVMKVYNQLKAEFA